MVGPTASFVAAIIGRRPQARVRRLREVEVHHVDLGLGYQPSEWSEEYVAWELPMVLATVPDRLRRPEDGRQLVAWLTGRSPVPSEVDLDPW